MEKADRPGQKGEARSNNALEDLGDRFKEDDDAKGCRGGVISFTGFRENNAVGPFERRWVVAEGE